MVAAAANPFSLICSATLPWSTCIRPSCGHFMQAYWRPKLGIYHWSPGDVSPSSGLAQITGPMTPAVLNNYGYNRRANRSRFAVFDFLVAIRVSHVGKSFPFRTAILTTYVCTAQCYGRGCSITTTVYVLCWGRDRFEHGNVLQGLIT
jgi:hypothetical protein